MPHPFHASTLLLGACLLAPAAQACIVAQTGGALGTVTTQRIGSGATVTGSGRFSFTCGPVVLAALSSTPTLRGQLQPSMTGLTLKNGGFSIPYQVYSDAGYSNAYTGGLLAVNLSGATLVGLLNGAGASVPIYVATTPGPNIPAGIYSDTVQLTWTAAAICEGLAVVANLCVGVPFGGTITSSIVVTLTVTNDCTITAPPVNFGTAPLVASFPTVSQNISLLCSRNMSYTVGLSAGSHSSGGRRRMAAGAARLQYDLFKADTTVWGSAGTARAAGPGPATGNSVQTIPYTARIYQDQSNPPPGTYTDNVVVDVSF